MRVGEPVPRGLLGRPRSWGSAKDIGPICGRAGPEGRLHGAGDPGAVLRADRVGAQRPGSGPSGLVLVDVEIRELRREIAEAQRLEHPARVVAVRGGDHVEEPAIGAFIGAVEGVEEVLEIGEAHVHGFARRPAALDLQLAG